MSSLAAGQFYAIKSSISFHLSQWLLTTQFNGKIHGPVNTYTNELWNTVIPFLTQKLLSTRQEK